MLGEGSLVEIDRYRVGADGSGGVIRVAVARHLHRLPDGFLLFVGEPAAHLYVKLRRLYVYDRRIGDSYRDRHIYDLEAHGLGYKTRVFGSFRNSRYDVVASLRRRSFRKEGIVCGVVVREDRLAELCGCCRNGRCFADLPAVYRQGRNPLVLLLHRNDLEADGLGNELLVFSRTCYPCYDVVASRRRRSCLKESVVRGAVILEDRLAVLRGCCRNGRCFADLPVGYLQRGSPRVLLHSGSSGLRNDLCLKRAEVERVVFLGSFQHLGAAAALGVKPVPELASAAVHSVYTVACLLGGCDVVELDVLPVVIGIDSLRSREIEDIVHNHGNVVAYAPRIAGLVGDVPLRQSGVQLIRERRTCRRMSRFVVVIERELHIVALACHGEPLVLIALYRLFDVPPEGCAERSRNSGAVNLVLEAVEPVRGIVRRGRARELVPRHQEVIVRDKALVAVVEVVPCDVRVVPVAVYHYGIPRVTHRIARDELCGYADLIEQHGIQVGVALADRHSVFQHTVSRILLAVRARDIPEIRGIVVIKIGGDVLVEVKRLFLVRPARLDGSGDIVEHSLVFGTFLVVLAVLEAVFYQYRVR